MKTETTVSSSTSSTSSSSLASQTSTPLSNLAAKQRDGRKAAPATPAFLSNLGRATLRGIRKCPRCGIYNGTRGLSCKNRACGISLRSSAPAPASCRSGRSSAVQAVKVIIDSEGRGGKEREGGAGGVGGDLAAGGVQVFSVCHRGRGSALTQLGFVELVPTDTAIATDGATLLTRINLGHCFVPACCQGQRPTGGESEARPAAPKQSSDSLCVHIKQAVECRSSATPLPFKSSVLEGLRASVGAREELWNLATESPGPLVQRVSRDTLVVKCHANNDHPLGLLHLTVGAGGLAKGGAKGERRSREQSSTLFQCACQPGGRKSRAGLDAGGGSANSQSPPPPQQPQPCLHFYACVCAFASDEQLASEFAAFINYSSSGVQQRNDSSRVPVRDEKPLLLQAEPLSPHHKTKRPRPDEPPPGGTQAVDERMVVMGFQQWLAGVTERIHQTMHYQFDGKPQPLVYHIPQEFFNALQQRLSLGSKKKRLPNFTTAFVRDDGLPLGSVPKYTWHITNLMQVKHIFDTPELPLELSQSFVKNIDGSYSKFHCPDPPPEPDLPEGPRPDRPQAIRPMELRTFLRVGTGAGDPKEADPFVIEWIPDVLPRCHMGELRISFEFGHQQSGQLTAARK
ncbi:uncharacterized protein C2orf42 homolog isoform X2 [Nelusetta ayraudi]|uniref:uncharacterized protein C2orf42 homolog isoform X2 n=1 Tax=Nelusetta ayraudi TaxID=303726 RepID=UPI003F72C6A1